MNYCTGRRKPGVKIELSKLKGAYAGHLTPFEGLWGFSRDLDEYPGTIFRFPLRSRSAQSKLRENFPSLDAQGVRDHLGKFLEEEGRIALLFVRKIQLMDFQIRGELGDALPRWTVEASSVELALNFSRWTYCSMTKWTGGKRETHKDRWLVAIEDLTDHPKHPQHMRTMKNIECGIAALVTDENSGPATIFKDAPIPKFFSNLPLPYGTNLPVHIHATFLLASDRTSMAMSIEESMREEGVEWNKWLYAEAIPKLYLEFLEELAHRNLETKQYFEYWPRDSASKGPLSEQISCSFWRLLQKSSCRLFPVSQRTRATEKKKHSAPNYVEISDAIFDLLPEEESKVLKEVLESQIPTLIRAPDTIRSQLMSRKMKIESITPKRLRELSKQVEASKFLEKATSKDPNLLGTFLKIIQPVVDHDFMELDGCRILPLADGTLGTLRLVDPSKSIQYYYMANKEEIKLFNFASGLLIGLERGMALLKKVMDYNKFNLAVLGLSDIGKLLERQNFGNKIPNTEMNTWLGQFWDYWRRNDVLSLGKETTFKSGVRIQSYPVFEATCDGVREYMEPEKLETLPSIIRPTKSEQRAVCDKFPGIYMFNFEFLPTHLRTEASLDNRASFIRFIKAIYKLAMNERVRLEVYVRDHLKPLDLKV
jgi:sacsin